MSCEEDELKEDNRADMTLDLSLASTFFRTCLEIDIDYLVTYGESQRSLTVKQNTTNDIRFTTKKGEFINIKAFNSNDTSNTLLAEANIDTQFYDETNIVFLNIYYTECGVINKIIWEEF
ncbi:hypothetical protein [uncultured Algibacter sp.]|uniref:hypothetical protein n=1 Tax=uncultured Algibacter sp. TaxID=298659 RepID=UPI00261AA225|nr:hypothetical protein [uncultured Algibacter sp.]